MTGKNARRKIAAVTFAKALVKHLMLVATVVFEDNFIMNAFFMIISITCTLPNGS